MAIIWQQVIEGNLYEVRTAGASVRLYRNGVNHSQWNPNRPLAGSIWDLITLPTLYRRPGLIEDVLVLGFGAGAVGCQLAELVAPQRIVGVELDPIHLSIANGFFECPDSCELVAADAVEWVQQSRGDERFDVVIEDLYGEADGVPARCVPMDATWCESLAQMLRPGGMLIFNLIEPDKVKHLPIFRSRALRCHFTESIMYRIDGYENRVIAFSDHPFDGDALESKLSAIGNQHPACRGVAERYVKCRRYAPNCVG
ncbi:MAG: class I SAM-dependent methyltransferase [Verrucomicrobia bacterium]|jgi:precorrin-6B methylase 2|nr:class I SAM-dependent methyltransferase [Verrucomicrobiota bacterium]